MTPAIPFFLSCGMFLLQSSQSMPTQITSMPVFSSSFNAWFMSHTLKIESKSSVLSWLCSRNNISSEEGFLATSPRLRSLSKQETNSTTSDCFAPSVWFNMTACGTSLSERNQSQFHTISFVENWNLKSSIKSTTVQLFSRLGLWMSFSGAVLAVFCKQLHLQNLENERCSWAIFFL